MSMSRGKLTTEAFEWSSEMCMTIVTSLRTAVSSSGSPNASPWPSRLSLPTMSRLTPPSMAPTSGTPSSTSSLPRVTVGFTLAARSQAAYAATAEPETSVTATTDAATFVTVLHALWVLRRPWRATAGVFAARREL